MFRSIFTFDVKKSIFNSFILFLFLELDPNIQGGSIWVNLKNGEAEVPEPVDQSVDQPVDVDEIETEKFVEKSQSRRRRNRRNSEYDDDEGEIKLLFLFCIL